MSDPHLSGHRQPRCRLHFLPAGSSDSAPLRTLPVGLAHRLRLTLPTRPRRRPAPPYRLRHPRYPRGLGRARACACSALVRLSQSWPAPVARARPPPPVSVNQPKAADRPRAAPARPCRARSGIGFQTTSLALSRPPSHLRLQGSTPPRSLENIKLPHIFFCRSWPRIRHESAWLEPNIQADIRRWPQASRRSLAYSI